MTDLIIFWHRRDLRIRDNQGLSKAIAQGNKVIGCFCLDPKLLTPDGVAPARVAYLLGCLKELAQSYQKSGSQLLLLQGDPVQEIGRLATMVRAKGVYWNLDVEPYAHTRDEGVKTALVSLGIEVQNCWDQLLHSPGEVLTKTGSPYTVYTPFWRNWSQITKLDPVVIPDQWQGLDADELKLLESVVLPGVPTLEELGFFWDNPLLLAPGEKAALEQLERFCTGAIAAYEPDRNFPGVEGTAGLSAALKFGVIGIRQVWQASKEAGDASFSEETSKSIQTWQQELAWREFYQHCLYFFPQLATGPYRQQFRDFPWEDNQEHFQAWCEGKTGYPMVDAAMRQLALTGWMHNRCRMIVASFLTKDLIINWQWGEKYFMQTLYDGDLSANNGGWQWSTSSGMDPKPLRIFNPATQAQKFDPEGEYIRQWLPELSSVDTEDLVTGKISSLDRYQCDYPAPIVDHNQQQREFKKRYQKLKSASS